jgi:2-oxoglutaroyl-CoA hydrolase
VSSIFRISETRDEGIARIVFGAPGELNIFRNDDRYELADAIHALGAQPWLKVLILESASERAFSAGVDVREFPGLTPLAMSRLYDPLAAPERIPQPVIAAIDGHCYGGPFELCLACDFRIVADTASLGLPEVTLGQMPGSGGGQRLLRLIGLTRAKELAMTGRRIDGATAESWGIATRCVPRAELASTVAELAGKLAAFSPPALEMIKRSLNLGADASLRVALELEGHMYATLRTTPEYDEYLQRWLDERAEGSS